MSNLQRLAELTEKLNQPAKILIAEDEPDVCEILGKIVAEEGYDPILAYNGKQAIDAFDSSNIQLVFLDLVMPIMDGFEFLEEFRQRGKSVPVIVITGNFNHEYLQRLSQRFGLICFLAKPFDPFVIRSLVNMFNLPRRRKTNA